MMKERTLDAEQKKLFGDITVKATDKLFEETQSFEEN
jgi:chromatin segregation and condensation protein Rec8/ScpA/Scc1 (kleisin family)